MDNKSSQGKEKATPEQEVAKNVAPQNAETQNVIDYYRQTVDKMEVVENAPQEVADNVKNCKRNLQILATIISPEKESKLQELGLSTDEKILIEKIEKNAQATAKIELEGKLPSDEAAAQEALQKRAHEILVREFRQMLDNFNEAGKSVEKASEQVQKDLDYAKAKWYEKLLYWPKLIGRKIIDIAKNVGKAISNAFGKMMKFAKEHKVLTVIIIAGVLAGAYFLWHWGVATYSAGDTIAEMSNELHKHVGDAVTGGGLNPETVGKAAGETFKEAMKNSGNILPGSDMSSAAQKALEHLNKAKDLASGVGSGGSLPAPPIPTS